jgi:hypothetical protein
MWRDSWSRAPTVTGSSPRSRPFSSRAARTSSPPTSTRPTRSRNKHGRGAARKGGAHVLAADRVHEAAALVGAFLDDSALQRCHPVGVGESATERATRGSRRMLSPSTSSRRYRRGRDPLQARPDDLVARRTIRAQGGEVHVVGRIQERPHVGRDRDRKARSPLHTGIDRARQIPLQPAHNTGRECLATQGTCSGLRVSYARGCGELGAGRGTHPGR